MLVCQAIAQVAPDAEIIEVSSRTGDGLDAWLAFLDRLLTQSNG